MIFIFAHLDESAQSLLKQELPGVELYWANKHALTSQAAARFAECEVCFGNVPAEWLSRPSKLRWLQLESVGFEYYQHIEEEVARRGLTITNLRGMFAHPAAETALAGLLALLRGLKELIPAQTARRWMSLEVRPKMRLLHGQRALVLGLGSIGRRVRELLRAFGCEVECFARSSPEAGIHTLDALDAQLGQFEVIVNCLPNTPETANLLDRRRLERCSSSTILVNVGRGKTVDEAALADLLRQGRLGGAVLDVFKQEPLPADHPLWSCPNTIITQHTGGGYDNELIDKARFFVANWRRFQSGAPLENIINLKRGY